MNAMLRRPHRTTYDDYLAIEHASPSKHEFLDGVVVAMAGASSEHNAIAAKLLAQLGLRLSGSCRAYSSDQRYWIESTGNARYSDGSIICGPPMHPAHDKHAATNPSVLIEVLSPSSELEDDGDKRRDYQSLPSLEAYVLIAQDARRVKIYRRERGAWVEQRYHAGERFALPRLASDLAVDDLYDGILDRDGRSILR